ncbi:MAG: hydrogenase 4 subunit F, partial [Acidithiobacillus ferrivorans]
MPILLVLICAATGIPLLALWGDGRRGAALFIGINTLTLLAILALAIQVLRDGAFTTGGGQFMVDDLSIVLVLVDGVVGLSTAWFSR